MRDSSAPENKNQDNCAKKEATASAAPAPTAMKNAAKKAFGTAMAGASLTTGIGMFMLSDNYYYRHGSEIAGKLINMTSLFTSHMTVWSAAIALGTLGWYAGKHFDSETSRLKPRGMAAALGVTLIAASFAWPVGEKIFNAVHDGLTGVFNKPAVERSLSPQPTPEELAVSSGKVPTFMAP